MILSSCGKDEKTKLLNTNVIIENRTEDCLTPQEQDAFCVQSHFQPRTITLTNVPGYPAGCTFEVTFEFKWCKVGPGHLDEVQALMKNFQILDIDCDQYHHELDDLINNPCSTCMTPEEYIFNLEEKLIALASIDVMNFLKQTQSLNFDCGSPTAWYPFVFKYSQFSCHSYCLRQALNSKGRLWLKPIRYACNGYVCCDVSHYMCIDPVTGEVYQDITKILVGGNPPPVCTLPNIIDPTCSLLTDCVHTCN